MENPFLKSATRQFQYYKLLGEQTMEQLTDEQLVWQYNNESNSIAIIVKHLHGNMMSRWTDFLTTDGEKPSRNRDAEFENNLTTKLQILNIWNEGWACCLHSIQSLKEEDLQKEIFIRNQGHTVLEAINRQLAHYPYHVGQIVFIGKMICDQTWKSLSIPKGKSQIYNKEKFEQEKTTQHFTDEFLNQK